MMETAQFEFINCLVPKTVDSEKLIKIGLQALAITAPIVIDSNRTLVYRAINSYLLEVNSIRTSPIDCSSVLISIATRYPDEVSNEIVNHILNIDYIAEKFTPDAIAELFENLCCLIAIRKFREEILQFLFHNVFEQNASKIELRNHIRLIGVRVLRHILDDDKNEQLHEEIYTKYNIFDRFLELIHSKQLDETNGDTDDFLFEMSKFYVSSPKIWTQTRRNNSLKNILNQFTHN